MNKTRRNKARKRHAQTRQAYRGRMKGRKPRGENMRRMTLRLTGEEFDRLQSHAERTGTTCSEIIRQALAQFSLTD